MKAIIKSILDTDLYKFTMQNFVLQHYNEVNVEYTFNNRGKNMKFNEKTVKEIKKQIQKMSKLKLTDSEYDWMKNNLYFLPVEYRQYLAAYRFNPNQVEINLVDGNLELKIKGKWRETILWEVPLMAIISEVYFRMVDTDWDMEGQKELANLKAGRLDQIMSFFTDFGTRRRRSFKTQDLVVSEMKKYTYFAGTSNCYLAKKYNIKALGTCAHEAISAVAALSSLNHPNSVFMEKWSETYKGSLGTMLPDTFGLESFLKDFTLEKAKLWDGVRHDSGDPFICIGKIKSSFGIGTHFTSDFKKKSDKTLKSLPMNMVIKLTRVSEIPAVKLSDDPGKAIGDEKMVSIMKYIHFNNYTNN
jgi:nicotinate phosphoribosyltransferase